MNLQAEAVEDSAEAEAAEAAISAAEAIVDTLRADLIRPFFFYSGFMCQTGKIVLDKIIVLWYYIIQSVCLLKIQFQKEIPKYRCAGPVQRDPVNHVRRETEQH